MTELTASRASTPWHLWVVGVVTLLFNALGIVSYLTTNLIMLTNICLNT